ncbi:MAG: TolC family protein [Bacteroidetes bacterium]|nr:TolC family protein [Bacteroidota bacterium]
MKEAYRMIFSDDPSRAAYFQEQRERVVSALVPALEAGRDAGEIRPLPTHSVAHMVMGNVNGLMMHMMLEKECSADPLPDASVLDTPGEAADFLITMLFDGLQPSTAQRDDSPIRRLDVDNANAQVREAWGQVMPQVDASASYTRNLKTANPFAGSEAGGLFESFGFIDWLAFNERARTDDDPASAPISFGEFQERQRQGLAEAGAALGGDGGNPFGVDNQFSSGISISQTLYNGSAFAAIAGAQRLKDVNQLGADRQEQVLIDQVRQGFYRALLAQEQARVVAQRVQRTRETFDEVSRRVAQGTVPKFQRLSTEVDLANQETQLVQSQNQAALALDNLKQVLAIPVEQSLTLRGALDVPDPTRYQQVSLQNAVTTALDRRPDVQQAQVAVELREIDKNITRSQYFPNLSAFANFNYTGQVPDDRSVVLSDPAAPDDPFSFTTDTRGFFSSSYWNPSVNVGLRFSWNIFNGFQTTARMQQREVAVQRAQVEREQLEQAVSLEVERALRDLQAAAQRIRSQERNVERAELNYEYADTRVQEGVSSQLELREASDQLDQSRLNYLQAVHDYLVARSSFETAIGLPMAQPDNLNLTSN